MHPRLERVESSRRLRCLFLLLFAWLAHLHLSLAQSSHRVVIEGMQFKPQLIKAHVGDTIVWQNADLVPHTATAVDGSFDSRLIEVNGEWSLVVGKPGDTDYTCTIHPQMHGRIVTE